MAQYIDADLLEEHLRLNYCKACNSYNGVRCSSCEIDDALDFIEDAPTDDVAPKSEVAREILAEVERIILDNTYPHFRKDGKPCIIWKPKEGYDALAELKKKYTEGET